MAGIWSLKHNNKWQGARGDNLLDSGAPFYDTYATADGRYVALGAIEGKFFDRLRHLLDLSHDPDFADQHDETRWDAMRRTLAARFRAQSLDHWCRLFEDEEVCFSPVMSLDEAPGHPHNMARHSFIEVNGMTQPAPVPRFSNTMPVTPHMWQEDSDKDALLAELGLSATEITHLRDQGAFGRIG